MEITINIPKNTYSVPTEVRQDAVQKICDAFIRGGSERCFHPFNDGVRTATLCAYKKPARPNPKTAEDFFYGFTNKRWCEDHRDTHDYISIRGCEMEAAFNALRKAGYHMFKVRYFGGSWMGYVAYEKPYFRDGNTEGTEVYEFADFID